ncbi:hypothetical protein [Clostridium beijerinckii]|uniref:hypothetical protein n=1 Tax=Clostridium beijerinckii TaxID=1520 RepID=UPI0015CC7E5E|nr:hypothetical protein [Clostridium beijerinckii]NYC91918.1 hypothetical protein [Clostridium beijerinckii]
MKAIVYLGLFRETPIEVEVTEQDIERGYAFVHCFECEGTGIWITTLMIILIMIK